MAPSRRKGANKAAASRRKWKVGDLVLAKVKGFPAWPATVSEPEKWGYNADWKKVVVHFFGSEQIAFCNHADVEEFTEEKKLSLLGRRHGKGADFVRAVTEIIDCFEKLKKQDQVTKANDNIASNNIDGSLTECVRDDDLVDTVKQVSTGTTNDLNSLTEAALAAAAEDALHDEEMQVDEAPSYLTRNKSDVARPKISGSRRRKSARVLRSSSRVDATRPQSTMMLSTINTRSSRHSSANASEDRSVRRNKRIVKSFGDSVGEDVDSLAFVSSDSTEESNSRIMTVDSDTLCINDGSNGDSGCKLVVLEQPFTENTEGETELSVRLDFPSNNAVIKRKRKPNRKGYNNDIVEAAKHDVVASDAGMLKNACVSLTFSEKSAQKYAKDEGDQHLPLVKRARVRMGMPSPTVEEEVTLVHKEEEMSEAPRGPVTESSEPLSFQIDCADTESIAVREDLTFSSLSHASLVKPILSETRKNYVDEEAALPPSKRLHRALEAMSANVAEDCVRASDCSSVVNIQSNGHCPSFLESSELAMGKRAKVELESESTENLRNGDSLVIAEDKTVSITQSSSSLTGGADGARASPPSSSICNLAAVDNNNTLEHNSSSSPDVQLHLEKAKLAGKCTSKGESLSSFEAIIRSLTRTKETIGRATRIAIDCAKLGFATKVVEILARNLESESSLQKKVDLFFLVDSITQCSRGIKGDGGVYPSAIQAILPRLLLAAAPPGRSSRENHRQCLKVLRVWQERKIIPESIIRHHIRELDVLCGTGSYPIVGSQRPLRKERAFDDPVSEMGGMLVDEYGSNSSIKLPGFCVPRVLRDVTGGNDSDGEGYEAVTPEHNVENHEGEKTLVLAVEKRSHILKDVDGELEMEDVAPCCESEIASTSNIAGADQTMLNHQPDNHCRPPITPQQPKVVALTSASLSSSTVLPPPHAHPLHTLAGSAFPRGVCNYVPNGTKLKPYSSCQEFNNNSEANRSNQTVLPRVKPMATDKSHHRLQQNKDFEAQMRHRQMPDSNNSQIFDRASNSSQRTDSLNKGFHLQPPHPAPSDQFAYVHDQRIQSRRDVPPSFHSNRFHACKAENRNFYKDRGRNKFVPHDNIGECWRPPFPSISGPCYPDDRSPMSYSGPPREPQYLNNRWDFPPRPMNHRHFNYVPSSQGHVPVANRGPLWRPR